MTLCINPKCPRPTNSDQTLFCQTCGSELVLVGKYRVSSELGSGGFGKTYEAIAQDSPSPLVLKVLINPMEKALELFQREAEVLGRLNHAGIPHVGPDGYFVYFPRNTSEPLHCLVMEKIEGLNLQEYITQRGDRPVNQKLVLKWLIEIVEILDSVHSQHFFHRDIKPSNVMLRSDGRLALIDFGTVREVTGTYVSKQEARGVTGIISAGYTPIEQLNGQAVLQSDFFSLGRTMCYLLAAKDPIDIYNAVADEFPWRQFAPNVHPDFANFLDQMMARVPKFRPADTQSILASLQQLNQLIRTQDPIVQPGNDSTVFTPISPPPTPPTPPPISAPPSAPVHASSPGLGLLSDLQSPSSNVVSQDLNNSSNFTFSSTPDATFKYADFGGRAIAFFLDLCILGITTVIVGLAIALITQGDYSEGFSEAAGTTLAYLIVFVHPVMTWLYFAVMHSSQAQATFGKRAFGLRVTTVQGDRISFGKATVRFMCKLLSTIVVVGYFITLFSQQKRSLHDLMAETLVIVGR